MKIGEELEIEAAPDKWVKAIVEKITKDGNYMQVKIAQPDHEWDGLHITLRHLDKIGKVVQ